MSNPKEFTDNAADDSELIEDESQILADQDQTTEGDISILDENMGARSSSLDPLEKETPDFMRGEVDVKEQMDLAAEVMSDSIRGIQEPRGDDDSASELDASFR